MSIDRMAFELVGQVAGWYSEGALDARRVSRELLFYCLAHPDPDCRQSACYALDDYLEFVTASGRDPIKALFADLEALPEELQLRGRVGESLGVFLRFSRWAEFSPSTPHPAALTPSPTYGQDRWLSESKQRAEENILILHGTWASGGWWLPNSAFSLYIGSIGWGSVYSQSDQFQWTGNNSDKDRRQAGIELARWLESHPHVTCVITHSHGGSVTFLASRELQAAGSTRKLERVVLLGVPWRTDYTPDLRILGQLRNVYSFADLVQTPVATAPHSRGEGRTISDSDRTSNTLAVNGLLGPSHTDLHTEQVWLNNRLDLLFQ
jgi:hypothetical protein